MQRAVVAGLVCFVVLGCGYRPGSFHVKGYGSHPPKRVQLGCLDLGVGLEPAATARRPAIRVGIANGCDHRIRIDLTAIRAEARDVDGNHIVLAPVAASWLRPRQLGARWYAREIIHYVPTGTARDTKPELREVCLDVAPVHASSHAVEHWICLPTGGAS